jgi:hypothetical protein
VALSRVFADNDLEDAHLAGGGGAHRGNGGTELTARSAWPRDMVRATTVDTDLAHSWATVDNEISPRM